MKAVWWEDESDPLNSEVTGLNYPAGIYNYNSTGHLMRDEKTSKWANAITEEDGKNYARIIKAKFVFTSAKLDHHHWNDLLHRRCHRLYHQLHFRVHR